MVTIKFRVWLKLDGKMCKCQRIEFDDFGDVHTVGWFGKNGEMLFNVSNSEVKRTIELMQYTGLKDKNGKEIYEGDILRRAKDGDNYHFYIVVEYKNGSFGGSTRPGFNHYLRANEWGSCDSDGGGYDEVIGNIHENPELLEVKK